MSADAPGRCVICGVEWERHRPSGAGHGFTGFAQTRRGGAVFRYQDGRMVGAWMASVEDS